MPPELPVALLHANGNYVHCFAHTLQLALLTTASAVIPVHKFISNLAFIINVVCSSSKHHDELQKEKSNEIKSLVELGEIKTDATYTYLKSFEFVFILHLIKEIMGRTDMLSQALKKKSQDILNAIELVSATKESPNDFRTNK
ncbi:hypothetical protein LXL04_035029 [Taraxacum kok-saghyz]